MSPQALGMCQGQSTTFFLCVPEYIPTKYNTIHAAIIIYDALKNQSALPLGLPEGDRVLMCTCLAHNARVPPLSWCIYQQIYIQQTIMPPNYIEVYCVLYEVQ